MDIVVRIEAYDKKFQAANHKNQNLDKEFLSEQTGSDDDDDERADHAEQREAARRNRWKEIILAFRGGLRGASLTADLSYRVG